MSHPLTVELSDTAYVALQLRARAAAQSPAEVAAAALEQQFGTADARLGMEAEQIQPRDDWERRLRSAATDCGVSLSNEAVSSEELYD
jgi:hypothetical protein